MNYISVLSCLTLLLAFVVAKQPKPCVAPPLLTGGVTVLSNGLMSSGALSYDAFGQKVRIRGPVFVGNQTFFLDHLMFFKEKVYYEINWLSFSCLKKPLDASFVPMHVPADADLLNAVVLGSSSSWGMGVLVNNWYGSLPGGVNYMTTFTEVGCIPLTHTAFGPGTELTFVSTFNWVLGLANPSDLHLPTFCANAKLEETETPDTFFTALASLVVKTQKNN